MNLPPVQCFPTAGGCRVYQLPMEVFPAFVAYAYLILADGLAILLDAGSGFGDSGQQLVDGFKVVRERYGEKVTFSDLTCIIITHGHIDHFGGLTVLRRHTDAPIGIHELDRRVLQNYEERLTVALKNLRIFLARAGVPPTQCDQLMEMYGASKHLFQSVDVAFTIHHGDLLDGLLWFYHTPGHCPGQVCIQVEDILFTADHVLSRTTPHQAPESITRYTGLGHYLAALDTVDDLEGIRLALAGHEEPIEDLSARTEAIRASHRRKLERVLDLCTAPLTIQQLAERMFPKVKGYHVLLALEEAGAHVEYLYDRGELVIANLDEVKEADNPPLQYRRA